MCPLAGGHSIDAPEPMFGLAVTGIADNDQLKRNDTAKAGCKLYLTKPLGVGIITTVLKAGVADPAHVAPAIESMKRLNRQAARLIQHPSLEGAVRACTDITGFALLGHSYEMAEKSGVQVRFSLSKLPFLDGAADYADQWLFPAGTCSNERAYEHSVTFEDGISEEMQQLLYTPETSGGLLVAVPPDRLEALLALFKEAGHPCWVVGEVVKGAGVHVSA